jgi:hypothetical protein
VGATASKSLGLSIGAQSCQVPPTPPPIAGSDWYQLDRNWASVRYDHVVGSKNTIGDQGCALLTLNYALNAAGERFDPAGLNKLMTDTPGDFSLPTKKPNSGGGIIFSSAVTDVSAGSLKFDKSQSGQNTTLALDVNLCSPDAHPVLVQVTNPTTGHQHYVVVTGKNGNSYSIVDPGYLHPPRTTLSDYGSPPQFQVVGVVKKPSGSDPSELDFSVVDNATLLVTAPDGTQTGFDSNTGQIVKGRPQSAYFVVDNADDSDVANDAPTSRTYSVQWFLPPSGKYNVQIEGLSLGMYDLAMKAFDANGKPETFLVSQGMANVGSITTFQVIFSPTPGTVPNATRLASYSSTLADITNALQLGLIHERKIGDLLSDNIERAAKQGETEEARESLRRFKDEVSDRTPRGIDKVAAQVLLDDAKSLLSQIPGRGGDE